MTEEAVLNTYARIGASALTWPIEKSKLLYQGGGSATATSHGNATGGRLIWNLLCKIPIQQHVAGMASSGLQRGGSAFFMFYTQSQIHQFTHGISSTSWLDQAIAGGVSGAITAPFHTYWELIKVRGMLPSSQAYLVCLKPMIFRHTIFDATFFGVNTAVGNDTHASWRFALAAASASFANLLWDVWKTRQMEGFPKRVFFVRGVLRSMTLTSFLRNYIVKGTDLTANWFAVGCLKDAFFPSPTQH